MLVGGIDISGGGGIIRSGRDGPIKIIKSPNWPQFRFEWHPKVKRVYLVHVGQKPEIGTVFAFEIENEGQAQNAVLIWLRGYRAAMGHVWDDSGKLIERKDIS
jgi:hypothetical protein